MLVEDDSARMELGAFKAPGDIYAELRLIEAPPPCWRSVGCPRRPPARRALLSSARPLILVTEGVV